MTATDLDPSTFSFDTLSFFVLSDFTKDVSLSNIHLEMIPEPSGAMLALSGLATLTIRRRR